jgi:hypothetical protein
VLLRVQLHRSAWLRVLRRRLSTGRECTQTCNVVAPLSHERKWRASENWSQLAPNAPEGGWIAEFPPIADTAVWRPEAPPQRCGNIPRRMLLRITCDKSLANASQKAVLEPPPSTEGSCDEVVCLTLRTLYA